MTTTTITLTAQTETDHGTFTATKERRPDHHTFRITGPDGADFQGKPMLWSYCYAVMSWIDGVWKHDGYFDCPESARRFTVTRRNLGHPSVVVELPFDL